ncbi:MAG: tetratricopeptide repeat protein [Vicinamibacterales bacterium]
MQRRVSIITRWGLLSLALGLAVVSMGAQGRGGVAANPLRQVRVALGHGDLEEARRLAPASPEPARSLSLALVDLFEGKDADAHTKLLPLAERTPMGDAALELALLELRTGQAAAGRRRLETLIAVRTFAGPDDYLRLARAARAAREFLLANDAYQRIADVPRAEVQAEWGDLFLEHHQPGDAVVSYTKALELDDKWVPALLGLSRALEDENPEASRKALDQARTLAPNHPGVALLSAEQQLEGDDSAAALAALDQLAKVKPNSIEEAALRAAVAYKDAGMAGVELAVVKVRELNPTSALGYRLASEQAARAYRFDDAAELARKAVAIDAADPLAQFDLGLHLMRTGDEAGARAALDASWELDKGSGVTKNLLDLLDHLKTFEIVPHGEFLFKFAKEETAVLRTYALPLADEAYRQFSERYGIKPRGPILVEVFPTHDDFAVRTLGLPGLVGALGACFGRVVTMDSPRARPPGDFSWQATLWHELAHVFSLQLSEYRVPRWLTEGISAYEEHRRQAAWGRELTLEYARELGAGKNFGLKKLPEAFKHPESLSLAYFEASLVVEHLVALKGEAGLRTLLLAYAGGAKDLDAFTKGFGQSLDEVETSFQAFVKQRYGALAEALRSPGAPIVVSDLAALEARAKGAPGNFPSQLALGQALVRADQLDEARAPLERAAALAPQASGDSSPHALLARIAESQKDLAKARREWRALLEYDHTNVAAARRLAELAAATQTPDDEDFALRLVADLDPFDAAIHGGLGRRLLAKGDAAPALIEFQAALALGPVNAAEAHTDAAEALLKLGRTAEARTEALTALKTAPTFARAQDVLLAASPR